MKLSMRDFIKNGTTSPSPIGSSVNNSLKAPFN